MVSVEIYHGGTKHSLARMTENKQGETGMRRVFTSNFLRRTQGQSMIETALLLPILLLLAFNAINFGYFFYVAVNLASAPRTAVQYSIMGFATPATPMLPAPGPSGSSTCPTAASVYTCTLAYRDINFLKSFSNAGVQVCTSVNGYNGSGTTKTTVCKQYGTTPVTYPPAPDPEAPLFTLARVDVTYTITPIIPAFQLPTPAGPISLVLLPNLTMHRQVSMREMN